MAEGGFYELAGRFHSQLGYLTEEDLPFYPGAEPRPDFDPGERLAQLAANLAPIIPLSRNAALMGKGMVTSYYCSLCQGVHDGEGPCVHKELLHAIAR